MIQIPRRSVTRFFIPLIDVLILLFCIYLLMPIVQGPGDVESSALTALPQSEADRRELELLRKAALAGGGTMSANERQELERLRRDNLLPPHERLAIRLLEIDGDTGKLFYYEPERVEIASENQAQALIERQKTETAGRELYYWILYPRKLTPYPLKSQRDRYDRWFASVAHRFENPRSAN